MAADHLLHLRPEHVRVDADPADRAQLEEREDQVVVARVEIQLRVVDDVPRLVEVVVRLLHVADGRDLGQLGDRRGLEVQDDPARDVVDDDRPVAHGGDRLEVLDDPPRRRLVVVRRDDEEAVRAELVRLLGQVDGVRGRVRAGAGHHGGAVADRVDRGRDELEPLVVGERRRLPGRARHDDAVGAVLDEVDAELAVTIEVDRPVLAEGRHRCCEDFSQHHGHSTPAGCRVLS